jgi:UDP-N-acetylglucosamine 2-epimerase
MRQRGRERSRNVIDAPAESEAIHAAILKARDEGFAHYLQGMTNPYGEGTAAERITEVLTTLPSRERLLLKRADADGTI